MVNDDLAARARALTEASTDALVVLDGEHRLVAASAAARERFRLPAPGEVVPEGSLRPEDGVAPLALYIGEPGPASAYEELRAGFTAAVSHELRTPLARLLALLESVELPGADTADLVERARQEVEQVRELIDDVLFLGELESGGAVVALGSTPARPVLDQVAARLEERAARANLSLVVRGPQTLELPLRPRMLRVVAENLAENALRYAGPGATFTLEVSRDDGRSLLTASDDGAGVAAEDIPRLFERFFRSDRARASRGTGLGLAIVKHVVTAAGGTVDAEGGEGRGLTIRCAFPG
jgi:two-component system phosphate regulon sensor histidine kinase PhoR